MKPNPLTYNDFYNTLFEVFDECIVEFVSTEEYEKAQLMLNAKLELKNDKELNDILDGNNPLHPPQRTKRSN